MKTLWYTRCPVPTATSIAINSGALDRAFNPLGIEIRSLRASNERDMREAHFDHKVTGLFRHGGNIPPMWSRALGADTALIGLSWVDEYQAIVALPESGIQDAAGLRGKKLGIPVRKNDKIDFFRAMSEHGYRQALKVSGVNLRDVELVPLSIEENYIGDDEASNRGTLWGGSTRTRRQKAEMFALIRGKIDAFYTSGSMGAYLAAMLGGHEVVNFGFCADRFARIGNQSPAALTVDRKLLREDPQLVARFLREIMRAATWAKTHKDECARILGRETGAPEEWVAPGYGPAFNECMEVALHDEWVRALEVQKNFLLEAGFIAKNFSIREWMDPEPLRMALQMTEPEEAAAS